MLTSIDIGTTTRPTATSIRWLLGGAVVVAVPLIRELPMWLTLVYFASLGWRLLIDRWQWSPPGRFVRALLAIAAIVFVYRYFGTLLGRDPGVALLVLLTGFKLLELGSLRDTIIAALLLLMMLLAGFLFDTSLLSGIYTLGAVAIVVAVLVRIQHAEMPPSRILRLAGVFVLQALPLMVAANFLFPRLPDALWGTSSSGGDAKTGIPENMSPGDITALNSSDATVFRAYFDGTPPAMRQLYWRVRVFWDNDGRTWQTGPTLSVPDSVHSAASQVHYRLVLEPSDRAWLPTLDLPTIVPLGSRALAGFVYEQADVRRDRQTLEFISALRYRTGPIGETERLRALALPVHTSERVRALAKEWRHGANSDADVVRAALDHFKQEPFFYTLTPPPLGGDPVDEFLFETRRGFCEHYAAAFVTLMRAAAIPARVVVGYQGGVYNPSGNYFIVRQADAHAWAEVWIEDQGWIRVDPTAAIAPARVEYGIDGVRRLGSQGLPLGLIGSDGVLKAIQLPWFERAWTRTRLMWDYANLSWYFWVADYNLERQNRLLERLGLTNNVLALAVVLALQLALLYALFQWRGRQRGDLVQRLYGEYCRKLTRVGIERAPDEGPIALRERASTQRQDLAPAIKAITELYVSLRYGKTDNAIEIGAFARAVHAFNPGRSR